MNQKTIMLIVTIGFLMTGCMMHNKPAADQVTGAFYAVSPNGTPIPTQANSVILPQNTSSQKIGRINVSLALSPYPPKSFKQTTYDVTLTDENNQPITDAIVSIDLTMPEMPMPANVPTTQYTEKGIYQAMGRFTMGGLWRIEVMIQQGSEKLSAFFYIDLNQ